MMPQYSVYVWHDTGNKLVNDLAEDKLRIQLLLQIFEA